MNDLTNESQRSFLGVGWAFPLAFTAEESVQAAAYEEDIRQAICIILGTNRGERVMRPEFGAGLEDFLFAPVNTTTIEQIKTRVHEALVDWEPRIEVVDVTVETATSLNNQLDILIQYRVRATNTLQNLVYPFYLKEGASQ